MAMRIQKTRAAIAIAVACLAAGITTALLLRRRRVLRSGTREAKPQDKFRKVLADNAYSHFKHLKLDDDRTGHPYEQEIAHLLENPPSLPKLSSNTPNTPLKTEKSYSWIDTESKLESLARLLSEEKIFAVDTEQHSFRSFLGFTALMQISTMEEDYLIDTIALHDVMSLLRPVFADPSICKVFHGADNDVIWLQRDFHIYVVNMFDTAKACEILSKPQKSLAYLLEAYCGVIADKSLQRGDWRIRPLPNKMIEYAIDDAHYLLYISNCLISELHTKSTENSEDCLFEASKRSNSTCMQLYSKEIESTPGSAHATTIFSRNLNFQNMEPSRISELKDIVWKLCAWRDLMARIHDESLRYILSDKSIASLATKLPKRPQEIYNTILESESRSNINYIILSHTDELLNLFQNPNSTIEDLFTNILDKITGCCPLSIYNYALLPQLNSKKAQLFSFSLNSNNHSNNNGGGERVKKGWSSRANFIKKFSCKSPVYHNCRIYASDGRLLCYCDKKKLEWYVSRNLATITEENPPAITLLFEPKGRPEDEDNDFYIQSKKNMCVGCGEKNHYIRYRIIPSCYRMHFPEHLKSHRSHDIVLLCVDCHEKAHACAERYKKKVAEEFGVPLFVQKIIDSGNNNNNNNNNESGTDVGEITGTGVSPLQLRTAAMALLRHGSTMPSARHDKLMNVVKEYYGGREVTREDLESALLIGMSPHERRKLKKKKGLSLSLSVPSSTPQTGDVQSANGGEYNHVDDTKTSLLGHGPHGKLVVERLSSDYGEEGILQFCQKWRQVFVEEIQPRFLPSAWNVNHSGRREFGEYSVYKPASKTPQDN